ncbi:hypothetical protein J2750_000115 [Methanococcoides alaskense]|uniref:Uncharacterized protein n=1 Tax=Methanococcoides alaskense TaxID=325778 RepID=A0AA90TXL5_9EURY|nr:hypothetical protein [Methanococcoides alaskense]
MDLNENLFILSENIQNLIENKYLDGEEKEIIAQ